MPAAEKHPKEKHGQHGAERAGVTAGDDRREIDVSREQERRRHLDKDVGTTPDPHDRHGQGPR
jgi:hypothetical protein